MNRRKRGKRKPWLSVLKYTKVRIPITKIVNGKPETIWPFIGVKILMGDRTYWFWHKSGSWSHHHKYQTQETYRSGRVMSTTQRDISNNFSCDIALKNQLSHCPKLVKLLLKHRDLALN